MSPQQPSIPHGPNRQRILNALAQWRYRQRKREPLQSLERRLDSRLGDTGAMYLPHPMQPPLLSLGNPGTSNDLYQGFTVGGSNASGMCLAPYESDVRDQFGISTLLPYDMPGNSTVTLPAVVVLTGSVCR
ncbi:hypothetical protein BJX99DRAFT_257486 [Aspergillus californicus]